MKHSFIRLATLATAILSFAACQKETETPKNETGTTHTISFIADVPNTKTSAAIEGDKVNYSWTKADEDKFTVYEIIDETPTAAEMTSAELSEDGVMTISALFEGEAQANASYQAIFNSEVKASQTADDETSYDQNSDILISEITPPSADFNNGVKLSFKRLVAINKATLKNLDKGSYLKYMVVESLDNEKHLAGQYSCVTEGFGDFSSRISVETTNEITGGTVPVHFVTLPVDDAPLKVYAVTVDNSGNFAAAYEKTLARNISFTRGDLHSFGVQMAEKASEIIDLTKDETTVACTDSLFWDRGLVNVSAEKSNTNANNYYPGTSGKNYSSTRFYANSTLKITPRFDVPIAKITFTATSIDYANALATSTWTNATATVSGTQVSITPIDGLSAVSAKISATTGHKNITIEFGTPAARQLRNITIADNLENGKITASPVQAYPGDQITLIAIPSDGYVLDEWDVTTSASEKITVTSNKFTMPDADVTVSATFKISDSPEYTSLADLIAAGSPTKDGCLVTVTLTNEEIIKFYTSGKYTNGVFLNVGEKEIEIFCQNVPSNWEIGGFISGTLKDCKWVLYNSTWELCPSTWDELSYKEPLKPCATPVITLNDAVATISCETEGATIHYTIGDAPADPTADDAIYTSAITLTDRQTIKAIAVKDGLKTSAVASKKYVAGGEKEELTAKYTVASTTSVTASGDIPEGSKATFKNTYSNSKDQITSGKSQTYTLSGYNGKTIKKVILSMHSNTSKGAGTFSLKAGDTTLASISSATTFNKWFDNTAFSTTYKDVTVTLTEDNYEIKEGENIVLVISATVNSLYCQSITIIYQ